MPEVMVSFTLNSLPMWRSLLTCPFSQNLQKYSTTETTTIQSNLVGKRVTSSEVMVWPSNHINISTEKCAKIF